MARKYYIMKDGERFYRDTLQDIKRAAVREANAAKRAVTVFVDDGIHKARSAVRQPPATLHTTRNPVMQGHDFGGNEFKITAYRGRTPITAYADTKAEAEAVKKQFKALGYTFTLGRQIKSYAENPKARRAASGGLVAYNYGKKAGREGERMNNCPYPPRSREALNWKKGWATGRA